MWSKIMGFFGRGNKSSKKEITNEDILEEVKNAKKLLRKQGVLQEAFRDEVLKQIEEKNLNDVQSAMDFTDSLFYLDASLKDTDKLSLKQDQALKIVWEKLESLFSSISLEIICSTGVHFDPRLYKAVERVSQGTGDLTVMRVIQPGFIYKGKVLKPAKAIIGQCPTELRDRD